MKWLVTLVGALATLEMFFALSTPLRLDAGVGILVAAWLAALGAYRELLRGRAAAIDGNVPAQRALIFAYECLIIGSANILARPDVTATTAAAGAAVLGAGQTAILWLTLRRPRVLRAFERPSSTKNLSVRGIITAFIYLIVCTVGGAVYVSRFAHGAPATVPAVFQWPGVLLLYSVLSCLAIGLACEHSRAENTLYVAVGFIVIISVWMELVGRRNWYFLGVSLLALLSLVPGWPRTFNRGPVGSSLSATGCPPADAHGR